MLVTANYRMDSRTKQLDGSSGYKNACGVDSILIAGGNALQAVEYCRIHGYKPQGITYIRAKAVARRKLQITKQSDRGKGVENEFNT